MKEIPLNKGQVALVDDADFDWLNQWKWYANIRGYTYYAVRAKETTERINGKQSKYRMHRLILGVTDPKILIDHIDHNGLNNQRSNLRIATAAQNCCNKTSLKNSTSKYLGVSFIKRDQLWAGQIQVNGIKKRLGVFKSEETAARAYDEAAKIYHGEYANLNFK